ncbi:MAG TPA: SDR family NAD(P)-dependent oxidoreductase [Novosphingobium sp.]|nr:SDR family NAD(P)-dependent oxidoreductase [Novosphingobium sp.]
MTTAARIVNQPPKLDPEAIRDKYGPWAVIAGGTEGTGESFARQLAEIGLNIMFVARRIDVMEALAADLRAKHAIETRTLVQDLMEPDAAFNILEASEDLDVGLYISNAGVDGGPKRFLNQKPERWVRFVTMNVTNVTVAAHGFGNRMRERGRGGILIMSSGSALVGHPYLALYSATKAFDLALGEALWGELAESNIDVTTIIAPTMTTPLVRKGLEEGSIKFDVVYECDDVAHRSLAQLGHAPVLMFRSSSHESEPDKVVQGRYEHLLQLRETGKRHVGEGGRKPAHLAVAAAGS